MTEAEWLGADSPLGMLGWLTERRGPSGYYVRHAPVSERKLRLFACACCRAVWHLLTDERSRRAVAASERHADGWMSAGEYAWLTGAARGSGAISGLAWQCTWPGAEECAWNAVHRLRCDGRLPRVDTAALLREAVGNPFRPAALGRALLGCSRCNGVALDDHGCPCRFGPLREAAPVARAAYEERLRSGALDPARLAILADALEDGGCDCPEVLRHLRGRAEQCPERWDLGHPAGCPLCGGTGWRPLAVPHYRGCWALDLVLGLS